MLSVWQKILQKIIKSAKQQDDPRSKDAPSPPVLRAELQIPQTIIDRYDAGQQKNDTREWWRLVIDGGTFVFAILGFYILYRTLVVTQQTLKTTQEAVVAAQTEAKAALSAAEIAGKQLELSERPWVTVDVVPGSPIIFREEATTIAIQVTMKNIGHSIATEIRVDVEVLLSTEEGDPPNVDYFSQPRMRRNELCEEGRQNADRRSPLVIRDVLFPGQETNSRNGTAFSKRYVQQKGLTLPNSSIRRINPIAVGCVSYQSIFSESRHITSFMYEIFSTPPYPGDIRVGEDLPVKNVGLRPYLLGDKYID